MSLHQLNSQNYNLKGSTQCTDESGLAKRHLQVLAGASDAGQFSHSGVKNQAQVVLQEGSSASAKTIACFTAEQARQLANTLNAAADAAGGDLKADC